MYIAHTKKCVCDINKPHSRQNISGFIFPDDDAQEEQSNLLIFSVGRNPFVSGLKGVLRNHSSFHASTSSRKCQHVTGALAGVRTGARR